MTTKISRNEILRRIAHHYDLQGCDLPDLHAVHFCRVFPKMVNMNLSRGEDDSPAHEVVSECLLQCLSQLKNTHLDWNVKLTESDVLPILRVLALAKYLEAPHEPGEALWGDLISLSVGKYDEVLEKGDMPSHLLTQVKAAWARWEKEENDSYSI